MFVSINWIKEYVDLDALAALYGIVVPTVVIGDGTVAFSGVNENGEAFTEEYPYMLENSQMLAEDDEGMDFVFELLEDGNIVMSVFVPGESEEEGMLCISIFLVRAEL